MPPTFDAPVLLDAAIYTTADITALTGVPRKHLENWSVARGRAALPVLRLGVRESGRQVRYSLLDALRFSTMRDLTTRVRLAPSDAVQAAHYLAGYVAERADVDDAGRPILDPSTIPKGTAFALAVIDGETRLQQVWLGQANGYVSLSGPWGSAHIVLPVAEMVAGLAYRLLEMLHTGTRA